MNENDEVAGRQVMICRACIKECLDYKSLYKQGLIIGEVTTLAALLRYCTNLDFDANETLPDHLCAPCVQQLVRAYLFKKTVLETNELLRKEHFEFINPKESGVDGGFLMHEIDGMTGEMTPPEETMIAENTFDVEEVEIDDLMGEHEVVQGQLVGEYDGGIEELQELANAAQLHGTMESDDYVAVSYLSSDAASITEDTITMEVVDDEEHNEGAHVDRFQLTTITEVEEEEVQVDGDGHVVGDVGLGLCVEQHTEVVVTTIDGVNVELPHIDGDADSAVVYSGDEHYLAEVDDCVTEVDDGHAIVEPYETVAWHESIPADFVAKDVLQPSNSNNNNNIDDNNDDNNNNNNNSDKLSADSGNETTTTTTIKTKSAKTPTSSSSTSSSPTTSTAETASPAKSTTSSASSASASSASTASTIAAAAPSTSKRGMRAALKRARVPSPPPTGTLPTLPGGYPRPHKGARSRPKGSAAANGATTTDDGSLQCKICQKHLRNSNSFKYHMQLHSEHTPYLCSLCGESFKTRNAYDGHIVIHDPNNPNTCAVCGKAYRQASSLRSHMLVHSGEKPYRCEICGKGMTQKSGYKKHLLTHTGEKPHTCEICGRDFRYSSNLLAHKRWHSGAKPFQCDQCSRCFPTFEQRKRHCLVHSSDRPFVCGVCCKAFKRRSALMAHCNAHQACDVSRQPLLQQQHLRVQQQQQDDEHHHQQQQQQQQQKQQHDEREFQELQQHEFQALQQQHQHQHQQHDRDASGECNARIIVDNDDDIEVIIDVDGKGNNHQHQHQHHPHHQEQLLVDDVIVGDADVVVDAVTANVDDGPIALIVEQKLSKSNVVQLC